MDQSRSNAYVLAAMREVCARICPEDATAMYEDVLRGMEPAPKVVEDKLLRTVSSMANILPRNSPQRSVLLASMCASQTRECAAKYLGGCGPGQYSKSRDDAGFIALGHEIHRPTTTRENYVKCDVEFCISHMLGHTDQESWGQCKYNLPNLVTEVKSAAGHTLWAQEDEKVVRIPRLRREAGVNESYRVYLQAYNAKGGSCIGECAHGQLLKAVTANQRVARAGVNYVEGNHLHDPLEKLYLVANNTPEWDAKLKLGAVRYFLKTEYLHRHAGVGACGTHSDRCALFGEAPDGEGCKVVSDHSNIYDGLIAVQREEWRRLRIE
jgi:hypothetical protein